MVAATRFAALALAALALPAVAAPAVACHYDYGGETRTLTVAPVDSPYAVPALQVGSYFRLRVVWQTAPAELAAVKVYVYADRDEAPVVIHQGTYPWPPAAVTRYGFTGLHAVYEPVRDGELQYWCGVAEAAP